MEEGGGLCGEGRGVGSRSVGGDGFEGIKSDVGGRQRAWYAKFVSRSLKLVDITKIQRAGRSTVRLVTERAQLAYMMDLREQMGSKYETYFERIKEGYELWESYLDKLSLVRATSSAFFSRLSHTSCHTLAVETGRWQRS